MTYIRKLLLIASLAGFMAAALLHILSILYMNLPYEQALSILWKGAMGVWMGALYFVDMRGFKATELWKAALRGCPRWMIKMVLIVGAYLVLNYLGSSLLYAIAQIRDVGRYASPRSFSSALMAIYCLSFAMLFSAIKVRALENGLDIPVD